MLVVSRVVAVVPRDLRGEIRSFSVRPAVRLGVPILAMGELSQEVDDLLYGDGRSVLFSEGEVRAGRVQPVSQPNELQVLRSQLSFAVHVIDMRGLRSFFAEFRAEHAPGPKVLGLRAERFAVLVHPNFLA